MTTSSPERELCPVCHFEWAVIDPDEVSPRINVAVGQLATMLSADTELASRRPSAERWSCVEYGSHLRDVLLNVRERLILTSLEDVPSPAPLYREERVTLGLYAGDSPATVSADLEMSARLFTATFDVLRPTFGERTLIYSRLNGDLRTLYWTGAQVLHECEHHLSDVRDNVVLLSDGDHR